MKSKIHEFHFKNISMSKQIFLLVAMLAITSATIAQTTTTPPLKDRIVGKWMYKGIEEFGVLTPADSTQKNDYVEILSLIHI
jgi:hypothetical protein